MTDDDRRYTKVRAFDDDMPTLTEPRTPGIDLSPPSHVTGPRYAARSVLGRGGMGEVRLCRDARIGRDVAVKVSPATARFLREARIQAPRASSCAATWSRSTPARSCSSASAPS